MKHTHKVIVLKGDNSMDTIEVYKDESDEYRWRRIAPNNEQISDGESYTRRGDAIAGAKRANKDDEWVFKIIEEDKE